MADASAGALIWDEHDRLLILKPTYEKGWTIPGGQIEAAGESPWDACRRETQAECGLVLRRGRLVCVDFRPPRAGEPGGIRFVFDCGPLEDAVHEQIQLQEAEVSEHRFAQLGDALNLLGGPLRRRVWQCAGVTHCVYLEDGRPLPSVTN
jgi:8-oxo-dGTP diphosphatase